MKQQEAASLQQQQKMQQQQHHMMASQEYFMMQQQQQRVPPVNMHMAQHVGQMPPQYAARMGYPPQFPHGYPQQASGPMMGAGPQYPNPQGGYAQHQQQMWHQNVSDVVMGVFRASRICVAQQMKHYF